MTLAEFDRMARGYLRRDAAQRRPLRWLGTILLNAHRGENDPAQTPEEVMWLYGDPPQQPPMQEEEYDATMARLAAFDTL